MVPTHERSHESFTQNVGNFSASLLSYNDHKINKPKQIAKMSIKCKTLWNYINILVRSFGLIFCGIALGILIKFEQKFILT